VLLHKQNSNFSRGESGKLCKWEKTKISPSLPVTTPNLMDKSIKGKFFTADVEEMLAFPIYRPG